MGQVSKKQQIAVAVPVIRGGQAVGRLEMVFTLSRFAEVLSRRTLPEAWTGAILDSKGVIVARSREAQSFVGKPGGANLQDSIRRNVPEGSFEGRTVDGIAVVTSFSRNGKYGWVAAIGVPQSELHAQLERSLWITAASALVLLAIGLLLARAIGQRIAAPIQALVEPALRVGRGETVQVADSPLHEAHELGRALQQAQQLLLERETGTPGCRGVDARQPVAVADGARHRRDRRLGHQHRHRRDPPLAAARPLLRLHRARHRLECGEVLRQHPSRRSRACAAPCAADHTRAHVLAGRLSGGVARWQRALAHVARRVHLAPRRTGLHRRRGDRRDRAQAGRGTAPEQRAAAGGEPADPGSQPAEERVPRQHVARTAHAAQRSDRLCRDPARQRRAARGQAQRVPEPHRSQRTPLAAPDQRRAGSVQGRVGQVRPRARAAAVGHGGAGGGGGAAARGRTQGRAGGHAGRRRARRGGARPRTPEADALQPAVQRDQVHRQRRPRVGARVARRPRADAHRGGRHRHRHRGRRSAQAVPPVPAGAHRHGQELRWHRPRPRAHASPRRVARRRRGCAQHAGRGQRVPPDPAAPRQRRHLARTAASAADTERDVRCADRAGDRGRQRRPGAAHPHPAHGRLPGGGGRHRRARLAADQRAPLRRDHARPAAARPQRPRGAERAALQRPEPLGAGGGDHRGDRDLGAGRICGQRRTRPSRSARTK